MTPKIQKKAGARGKPVKKKRRQQENSWMVAGFDLSLSSLAGAAMAWDATLKEIRGPVWVMNPWAPNIHYFERISQLARAENFIHNLQVQMKVVIPEDEIYIAIEEPFPMGMVKRLESQTLKQAAELSGALMAGLLRYGYQNVFQIRWSDWAQIVAADLGITIHHSKWNYDSNPFALAPSGRGSGKWRSKEWALALELAPDWTDLISREKTGKIPRPEGSRARAVQPDDRYDATAIMEWMRQERQKF